MNLQAKEGDRGVGLRERRLGADALEMSRFENEAGLIVLLGREGDPPERYTLEYRVKSLVVQDGDVVPRGRHRVEIFLTLAYPRQSPQCRMLTPVFHPNIAPHAICIGDHWTAGESLAALCVRIAEMLCFQSYNVKSPLNGEAAQWVEQNVGRLPLERTDFWKLLAEQKTILPLVQPDFQSALSQAVQLSAPKVEPRVAIPSTLPPGLIPVAASQPPSMPKPIPSRDTSATRPEISCPRCGAVVSVVMRPDQVWARCPLCGTMIPLA